jgi:hypothetical protein
MFVPHSNRYGPPRPVTGTAIARHSKHTYEPPRPDTGTAVLFLFLCNSNSVTVPRPSCHFAVTTVTAGIFWYWGSRTGTGTGTGTAVTFVNNFLGIRLQVRESGRQAGRYAGGQVGGSSSSCHVLQNSIT